MTDELTTLKQQIVAAVQQQLTQYSEQVRRAVQGLRDEIAAARTARTSCTTCWPTRRSPRIS